MRGIAPMLSEVTPPRRFGGGVSPATVSSTPPIGVFSSAAMAFLRDEEKQAVATQTGPDNRLRYHAQTVRTLSETKATTVPHVK